MAVVNYKDEIERSTEILKVYRKSKELFANEENMLILEQERYRLYRSQIHDYLAPQKNQVAEQEIQDRVKEIVKYDLPICRIKIERFKNAIPIYERKKDIKGVNLCYKYLQEWLDLYELNYALVSFRSLEHFALFMEWEKPDNEKVWTLSNDPYNDGGYTGVTKPFFYNFNRMVLKKDIKFISKQMFTGGGKCLIPTTKIMTPTGTKMLKDIEVGDYVYSMKDNKLCERRVLNKWHTKKKQITITTRGGVTITVSPEHRLYTQRGYIEAKEINQSDYLYRVCAKHEYKNQTICNKLNSTKSLLVDKKDFIWEQVKSIEYNETKVDMIDIEVEETHNFIANHIVSHNSYSNAVAISWLLGIDQNNDILDVLGNPTLVLTNARGIVNIMTNPRFAKVFPNFQKFHDMGGDVTRNMFSVCRLKEGELTLADSTKTLNVKIISKDTSIDGIRVRYLFLDDICRSKDANNLKQHQIDINNFWNSWYKRNYGTDDFYIIISGTAYSVNDIMSHLIAYFTKGKMQRTKENKYTYQSLDGTSIIIKIPKIDDDLNRSTFPQKFPYKDAIEARDRDYNTFMAMEQQQPQNPETSPLCWEKINTYSELPSGLTDYAYAVLDPARTGKNYVSMPIKRMKDEVDKYNTKVKKHYLVDCVFQLKQMADLYSEICDKVEQHHIIRLHIENNTDTSLKFLIEKLLLERGITFCVVSESFSTENKEEKIRELVYSNEGYFKNQMVYPEMQLYAPSSQMGKYMLYLTSYDYYQKMEYDDSIDAECMYIEKFVNQNSGINKAVILRV